MRNTTSIGRTLGCAALLALALPGLAQAQVAGDVSMVMTGTVGTPAAYDKLTVKWTYTYETLPGSSGRTGVTAGTALSEHIDDVDGMGFNVYYLEGTETGVLNTRRELRDAEVVDAALGKSGVSRVTKAGAGQAGVSWVTTFEYELKGLDPETSYVVTAFNYSGDLDDLEAGPPPEPAAPIKTGKAPSPTDPRDVEAMAGDAMLMVSWQPPVRAGGGSTTIMLDRYEVRWRWSQTAENLVGDWTYYPPLTDKVTKHTATTYTITSLTNDVSYDVQVRAINDAKGMSEWSPGNMEGDDAVRATPTAGATPTPVLPTAGLFILGAGLAVGARKRLRQKLLRA
jgi:hypothetical protein